MLSDFFEYFEKIEIIKKSDGMGGYELFEVAKESFSGAITIDKTLSKLLAGQEGIENNYILCVPKTLEIELGDIVKKASSNYYYKVTNYPEDHKVPKRSSLDFKQVALKRYIFPTQVII